MNFFLIDENISQNVAAGLRGFGYPVYHVKEELGQGTPDEEIFHYCRRKNGILITGDWRMQRNAVLRAAMRQAGIGVFILTGRGRYSRQELGLLLHRRMEEMLAIVQKTARPFVFGIPPKGRIKRVDRPPEDERE